MPGIDIISGIESVDLIEMKAQQEAMVLLYASAKRLAMDDH
jgi:hypothetical protein